MKFLKLFLTLLLVSTLLAKLSSSSMDKTSATPTKPTTTTKLTTTTKPPSTPTTTKPPSTPTKPTNGTTLDAHIKLLETNATSYENYINLITKNISSETNKTKIDIGNKNIAGLKTVLSSLRATIATLKTKAAEEKAALDKVAILKASALTAAAKQSSATVKPPKMKRNLFEKKGNPTSTQSQGSGTADLASKGVNLAKACTSSFFLNVPPSICWKKGGDFGIIPTDCEPGFFRHLALCFENCKPGWSFDGGAMCLKDCPPDTKNVGLTCTHFSWKVWEMWTVGREPYFPRSKTNFENPCPSGYVRQGALCYRDCAKIGLTNCGIGMCASSGLNCASGITGMVADFLVSIAKGVTFVLSFGTSTAATAEITEAKSGLSALVAKGTDAIKAGIASMKNIANNPELRKQYYEKMKSWVMEKVKDKALQTAVSKVCETIGNQLFEKTKTSPEGGSSSSNSLLDKAKGALDAVGLSKIITDCSNVSDGGLKCATSALKTIDVVDPAGLSGMASAFMKPLCDI